MTHWLCRQMLSIQFLNPLLATNILKKLGSRNEFSIAANLLDCLSEIWFDLWVTWIKLLWFPTN